MSRGDYFKTETQFWNWMRSQLRRVWSTHPTKLDFLKSKRYTKRVGNRPIYHIDCAVCNQPTPLKNIEVNHKVNCGNPSEAGYHLRMLDVLYEDLEAVCKPCHSIITYSERMGISFEEAVIEKQVVAFGKLPAAKQKEILDDFGQPYGSTVNDRKQRYREELQRR